MKPAAQWSQTPYPGQRPEWSYVQVDDFVLPITHGVGGATVDGTDLNIWLAARGEITMAARTPVLAYGSNACPSKLVTMRERDGLTGAVVMTTCTIEGVAAAWCTGRRRTDNSVVATLVEVDGSEEHFIWWVAPDQWAALDDCEGAPTVYALQAVPGIVRGHDGRLVPAQAYIGVAAARQPRHDVAGRPLLVRDVSPDVVQHRDFT